MGRLVPTVRDVTVALLVGLLFWHVTGRAILAVVAVLALAIAHVGPALASWSAHGGPLASRRTWGWTAALALTVAIPFLSQGGFRTAQLTQMLSLAIILQGLNLLTGYTGQISIGHSAFAAVGAYITAILLQSWHVEVYLSLLAAVAAAGLAGFIAGWPALRLSGIYLAIVTVALAVMFPLIVNLNDLQHLTGGYSGISLTSVKLPAPGISWLTTDRWNYFFVLLLLGVSYLAVGLMLRGGRKVRLLTIRDSELLAAAMGVNVRRVKLAAFTVSAAIAGMGGFASFVAAGMFVSPDSFTVLSSVNYLVALTVGGLAASSGPLLGAIFFIFVYQEGLDQASASTQAGSNWWLIGVACVVAIAVARRALRSDALRRLVGRVWAGARRQARAFGATAVAGASGVVFVVGFRVMTSRFLNLQYLNEALAGVLLIVVIRTMPGGVSEALQRLDRFGGGSFRPRPPSPISSDVEPPTSHPPEKVVRAR
jgi:branched-chain amino acid transport system permease protein